MRALDQAVLRGEFYTQWRDVTVEIVVQSDSSVKLELVTHAYPSWSMYNPRRYDLNSVRVAHQAGQRLMHHTNLDFVLCEVGMEEYYLQGYGTYLNEYYPSLVIGLVPAPAMHPSSEEDVEVRMSGESSAHEFITLKVRSTDEIIPVWYGTYFPCFHSHFIEFIGKESKCNVVVAMLSDRLRMVVAMLSDRLRMCAHQAIKAYYREKGKEDKKLNDVSGYWAYFREVGSVGKKHNDDSGYRAYFGEIGSVGNEDWWLPDLREALLDRHSEARTRERTRVIFEELMKVTWNPEGKLAKSLEMLDT